MAIPAGTRLGAYQITAPIGAGGMGEVYRAHDSRLLRDVAVKVLPSALAADADRLRRFEQEARATAALNHPNILAVYDVGRAGEIAYVVEELLDGETLRERLTAPLPARKVVEYAVQIANGLAAAHDKGIVHRDLKPENVFVTRDDRVKILDFGLAKITAFTSDATSTGFAGGTEPGVVLGTVGYMAPEQVRGVTVDHRADLFSLGAVLYEMLTGRRAFQGDTAADTISALLKEAPADPAEAGRPMPSGIARIVWRCLEKNPALRFQSATDLAFALQAVSLDSTPGSGVTAAPAAAGGRARWILPLGATLLAGVALGGVVVWMMRPPAVHSAGAPIRFNLSAVDGPGIDDLTRAVVSPDGTQVAITEALANERHLMVLSLSTGTRRDLGVVAAAGVCWSPDGTSIAYFGADRALYKVNVDSMQRQRLAPLDWAPYSASWSTSGDIFVVASVASPLTAVPASGGAARQILAGQLWTSVHALPDGRRLLLSRGYGQDAEMVLATADGSRPPVAIGKGSFAQHAPPDLLVALRGNQLVAWRTPLDGRQMAGEPTVIADGVLTRLGMAMMPFSMSPAGVIVYRAERHESRTRLAWFDRGGRESGALALKPHCRNPELSPGFDLVAVECWDVTGGRDIWVYDLARDAPTRLTTSPSDDADPLWTPDGKTIVFASSRQGSVDVYRITVGGGRSEELVVDPPGSTPTMALSPDGKDLLLLATGLEAGSGLDLATYRIGGTGGMTPVLKGAMSEIEGQFSPDGKYFLYASNQSGRFDVYVERWPQTGERWPVSTDGGTDARWSPTGQEIFYLSPDRRLMAVPIRLAGSLTAGRPFELFQTRVAGPLGAGHRFPFAVAKDGQRFLMYVSDPQGPPAAVSVIANWPQLMGAR